MVTFSAHIEYGITEKYRQHFSAYHCASANWDPNKQIEDIRALLARGIDALLIDPMDAQVVATGVQEAFEAGVAVIVASSPLSAAPYVCFATLDAEGRGIACADWMLQHTSGGQVIVVQSVPAAGDSASWLNGVRQRLQGAANILATVVECPWSVEGARESIASWIGELTIDGVIVENGLLGRGVVEAFAERGMAAPPIAGVDDWNGWLRTARESGVRFLAQSGGTNVGLHAVELAVEVLSGQQVPRLVELPYEVFDQSGLHRYYRPDLTDHYWAIHELPQTWIERMFRP
jgi:ribose transport system substrate-binding protein